MNQIVTKIILKGMNCEQVVLALSAYIKILKNIFQHKGGGDIEYDKFLWQIIKDLIWLFYLISISKDTQAQHYAKAN